MKKTVRFNSIKFRQLIILKAAKAKVKENIIRKHIKKKLGITKQTLCNWETGRKSPVNPDYLCWIRNYFKLPNLDCLFIEGD